MDKVMENKGLYLYQFHEYLKPNIERILSLPNFDVNTVVELGVFQGYFTFNMTHMMAPNKPNYTHYAIDPFDTSEDLDRETIANALDCFEDNLQNSEYSDHIKFIRVTSHGGLYFLKERCVQADLIYIDGSHMASDVLQDLVLSWNILNKGGVILCDDSGGSWMYADKNGYKPVQKSPRLAVENFIQCFWDKIEIIDLPNNWQTAFRKIV